jgi:hypothetical protein
MASLATDIREKTSKSRQRNQCDAVIAHARSSLWRLDNPVDSAAGRAAQPIAVVAECRVLGGHGLDLAAGTKLDMRFLPARVDLAPPGDQPVPVPYDSIVAFEIGGPGARKSGGGFFGGGFGLQGAAEGMLVATALNLLTTRTNIDTVICLQTRTAELFVHHRHEAPDAMRIRLSQVFSILRSREAQGSHNQGKPPVADPIEQLERLAKLHETGILTEEEFQAARLPLVQRLTELE